MMIILHIAFVCGNNFYAHKTLQCSTKYIIYCPYESILHPLVVNSLDWFNTFSYNVMGQHELA